MGKFTRFYVTWTGMDRLLREKSDVLCASRTIPVASTRLSKIEQNAHSKSIVVYGTNLGSNIGFKLNS